MFLKYPISPAHFIFDLNAIILLSITLNALCVGVFSVVLLIVVCSGRWAQKGKTLNEKFLLFLPAVIVCQCQGSWKLEVQY
jgi:hypothetical protein